MLKGYFGHSKVMICLKNYDNNIVPSVDHSLNNLSLENQSCFNLHFGRGSTWTIWTS